MGHQIVLPRLLQILFREARHLSDRFLHPVEVVVEILLSRLAQEKKELVGLKLLVVPHEEDA